MEELKNAMKPREEKEGKERGGINNLIITYSDSGRGRGGEKRKVGEEKKEEGRKQSTTLKIHNNYSKLLCKS